MARMCPECGFRIHGEPSFCPQDGVALVADPMVGRMLGSSRVEELLGLGAMGTVYQGRHIELGRPTAVKLLRAAQARGAPELVQRFKAEARAVSQLESPYTVRLYEFGSTPEGDLYLTMEMLEGRNLQECIDREGPQPAERVAAWAAMAARSLAEAHRKDIVHRDLKPGNLILGRDDRNQEIVRVVDFGIARLQGANLSHPGMVVGTPGYMAPEQIEGHAAVDGRADIYALGVCLYELLTGHNPFIAAELTRTLARQLRLMPQPPTSKWHVPDWFSELVMSMLAKKPEGRPQTMEAVGEVLERGLADERMEAEHRKLEAAKADLLERRRALHLDQARLFEHQSVPPELGKGRMFSLAELEAETAVDVDLSPDGQGHWRLDCPSCKTHFGVTDRELRGRVLSVRCDECRQLLRLEHPDLVFTAGWFTFVDDERVGPMSLATLGELRRRGRLKDDDKVWSKLLSDWQKVSEVAALRPKRVRAHRCEGGFELNCPRCTAGFRFLHMNGRPKPLKCPECSDRFEAVAEG